MTVSTPISIKKSDPAACETGAKRCPVPLLNKESSAEPWMSVASRFVSPVDGWYHLAPIGEFRNVYQDKDGKPVKVIQVIDAQAVQAMANSFHADAIIDYEHESHDQGKRTEAAGWISQVQARPDGLWMLPRWTDEGEKAVTNGRYRYISPVWYPEDCEPAGPGKLRPLKLADAGLTNRPNLRGMKPLTNRRPGWGGRMTMTTSTTSFDLANWQSNGVLTNRGTSEGAKRGWAKRRAAAAAGAAPAATTATAAAAKPAKAAAAKKPAARKIPQVTPVEDKWMAHKERHEALRKKLASMKSGDAGVSAIRDRYINSGKRLKTLESAVRQKGIRTS